MENVFRVLSIVGISFIFFSCIHSPESIRMPKTDEEINKRIEEIRTKTVTLSLKSKNGKVLAKNWITIEQTKHAFLFGCSFADYWNDISPVFEKNFTAIFNFATLPIYWAAYNEKRVERMTEWCMKRGITVKAHPLVWHEVCPQLTIKTNEEAEKIIKQRVMSVVSHFKGSVDMFDIINESLVSFRFKSYSRFALLVISKAFRLLDVTIFGT